MSTSHSTACLHLAILPPFLPEITILASSFIRVKRYKPSPSDQNSKPLPTLWVDSSLSRCLDQLGGVFNVWCTYPFSQPLQPSLLVVKRRMLGLHQGGQRNRSKCVASCALQISARFENGFQEVLAFSKTPVRAVLWGCFDFRQLLFSFDSMQDANILIENLIFQL